MTQFARVGRPSGAEKSRPRAVGLLGREPTGGGRPTCWQGDGRYPVAMGGWVAFDWESIVGFRRHHLPHVTGRDAVYFVTYRLNDSIPAASLVAWRRQLDAWLAVNPPPHDETQKRQMKDLGFRRIEDYLNDGHGSCLLRDANCRGIVAEVLHGRDQEDYLLGEYVIMPNHVHVVVKPTRPDLSKVVGAWKSISSRRINKLLGRSGSMWQDEWFDHIVRSPQALHRIDQYIRENPGQLRGDCATVGRGSYGE